MEYEANRRVETSARTFAIVERLSRVETTGVSTLADELGMNKGIVHNHLSTLRELGYVAKVDDAYRLTPKLLTVGFRARSNTRLYQFGTELLTTFADQFDVGVLLCQQSGSHCTVIEAYNLAHVGDVSVGTAFPLFDSLLGLVVALTDGTATEADPAAEYDVESIRVALDEDEYVLGTLSTEMTTDCVAVPIVGDGGVCRGSVGVLLPAGRGDERTQRLTEATVSLRRRLENRFDSEWTGERSFATEKHAWID